MTVRFQRLIIILLSLIFTAGAVILILINSKENFSKKEHVTEWEKTNTLDG